MYTDNFYFNLILDEKGGVKLSEWLKPILVEYCDYVSKLDVTDETKKWRIINLKKFIYYINFRIRKIDSLKEDLIYEYVASITNKYRLKTMENIKYGIRLFCDWLYLNKYINYDGHNVFPIIKSTKRSNIISYYSNTEICKILNSIDINKENGKRNIALLSLFVYLGLREKDVINLKFENVDWKKSTISIHQQKTKKLLILPLIDEVKYPLVSYIKNERPNFKSDYIFINESGKKLLNSLIWEINNCILKQALINVKERKRGVHSYRHSLATNLLNNDKSIYNISSILGHTNIEMTNIYLCFDEKKLKELSLEVPLWNIK